MVVKNRESHIAEIEKHIACKLRLIRSQKQLTCKEVARTIGVSNQQLVKYENGINKISIGKLLVLSKALDIDVSYFYQGYEDILSGKVKKISLEKEQKYLKVLQELKRIKNPKCKNALITVITALSKSQTDKGAAL